MAGLPWFKQQVDLRRDPRALILGDILGDTRAWTYVVEMRMYLAEHAPTGCVSGAHADIAFERGSGWTGERGRLLAALRDAGFISATPAREGGGIQIEDLDWVREQGAHVRKFQADAQKPDGRAHKVVTPSREVVGSSSAPARLPRGESRELRVEKEASASQGTASPSHGEDFQLKPTGKPPKAPRKQSPQEELYDTLQRLRRERCAEVGETFIPDRWSNARQNKDLGPDVKASKASKRLFSVAWGIYLADDGQRVREPAWALGWFMAGGVRARYETQAARELEGEAA